MSKLAKDVADRNDLDIEDKIKQFSLKATSKYSLTPLEVVTYWYYTVTNVNIDSNRFYSIFHHITTDNNIRQCILYNQGFSNIRDCMRWLVASRCAKIAIQSRCMKRFKDGS